MTKKEKSIVKDLIEEEGFHFAMKEYTEYIRDNVDDPKFETLLSKYLKAADDLEDYIYE